MTRITPDHLDRGAFVYIRQSTADQVLNNHEVSGGSMDWLNALTHSAGRRSR